MSLALEDLVTKLCGEHLPQHLGCVRYRMNCSSEELSGRAIPEPASTAAAEPLPGS